MTTSTPPRENPTHGYGQGEALQDGLGIDLISGQMIAAIIIFGSNIEHYLEAAIWQLRGQPIPERPDTDKRISDRMSLFDAEVAKVEDDDKRRLLEAWSEAFRSGLIIRNNIVHGVTLRFPWGQTSFMRNPQWDGVKRKQEFGMFTLDISTLTMVRDAFAVMLRVIHKVSNGSADLMEDRMVKRAVNEARSILGEFADHTYGPHYEKY